MSSTMTPNMNLTVPGAGTEGGPAYAEEINADLALIDQHDHTPGYGVAITPAALNINTALTLSGNFLTATAGVVLQAQSSTPVINTVYQSGVDLYFVDGLGNNVQITQNGGIAGSPGSISNLTSPASASYVSGSKTFVWQSAAAIAANMDFAAAKLRNITPNSTYALTLQPPAALAADYTLTLPLPPASSTSFITMTTSGAMATSIVFPLISTSIATGAITNPKIDTGVITSDKFAGQAVDTAALKDANVTYAKLASNAIFQLNTTTLTGSGTWSVPTGVNHVIAVLQAGGGGGGGNQGGGGAAGGCLTETLATTPGGTVSYSCGAGGTLGGSASGSGGRGASTTFGSLTALGGRGGTGGSGAGGAATAGAAAGGAAGVAGQDSAGFAGGSTVGFGGGGGASQFAAGANGSGSGATGIAGTSGSGASGGGISQAGAAGGAGLIKVYWVAP